MKLLILRCSWSIACRRYSNYIFILDLAPGSNRLGKYNCKTRRELFIFLWFGASYIRDLTVPLVKEAPPPVISGPLCWRSDKRIHSVIYADGYLHCMTRNHLSSCKWSVRPCPPSQTDYINHWYHRLLWSNLPLNWWFGNFSDSWRVTKRKQWHWCVGSKAIRWYNCMILQFQ